MPLVLRTPLLARTLVEVARATQGLEILVVIGATLRTWNNMVNMHEAGGPEAHLAPGSIALKDATSLARSYIWHAPSVPQGIDNDIQYT